MTVTVVVASYKYGHLVAHAVESVLSQIRKPDRIIVLDDGIGDCVHIRALYPEVDLIERPHNLGVVVNFNKCLFDEVQTDKVLFLGADNWLADDALELLCVYDADIVSYDVAIEGERAGLFPKTALSDTPLHGSSMYDVQKARAVGGYAASGNAHTEEDSVLFSKMLKSGATRAHVPVPLLHYRRHRHNGNTP